MRTFWAHDRAAEIALVTKLRPVFWTATPKPMRAKHFDEIESDALALLWGWRGARPCVQESLKTLRHASGQGPPVHEVFNCTRGAAAVRLHRARLLLRRTAEGGPLAEVLRDALQQELSDE